MKEKKPRRVAAGGNCWLCGMPVTKARVFKHIQTKHLTDPGTEQCHVIKVSTPNPDYWLYLDAPSEEMLSCLDDFLRKIWVDCCGHLSRFHINRREIPMDVCLCQIAVGTKFSYQYDFGSTTELDLSIVATAQRKPLKEPVRLLARNASPKFVCCICGLSANLICCDCMWESDNPFFCKTCAESHRIVHESTEPLVNSPRMGVCGYHGGRDRWKCCPKYEAG